MRFKLTLEYDGSGFYGFQKQKDTPKTVQGTLERAIEKCCDIYCPVQGAGRTDQGVHALGMTAHVDVQDKWEPYTLMRAINSHLWQTKLAVKKAEMVTEDFHARFSATKRHYMYRLQNTFSHPVIHKGRVGWVPAPLDLDLMLEAAEYFKGTHDFTSFRGIDCGAKSPVRTLDRIDVLREGDEIHFHIAAQSFLYKQIRNIVGSLVMVGQKKHPPIWIKETLDARDRTKAGKCAEAQGLYFIGVEYTEKFLQKNRLGGGKPKFFFS